ncbi:hypothetical protein U14_02811 [Candidatus Moduliflexus flocculans]|uniref:PPM-type phosphatase domain-containing protein n=1 Tax=Candidatus Moduliflexus flocculans TaxID=1499966 RepID=A0A081BMF0_9BACT|nr:hypothetical protein U14_02811 [Candidatus Moduliflexus flocculans]
MEKIFVDGFFTIARQHRVCQDYAIAAAEPLPLLALSDGCSSSPDTDIGSRLLVKSAEKVIRSTTPASTSSLPTYQELGSAILANAVAAAECLALRRSALDATLLLAFAHSDAVTVMMYGDGYLAAMRKDGSLEYISVSYNDNMPYYLNYWTDEPRKRQYLAESHNGKEVVSITTYSGQQQETRRADYDAPLVWTFPASDYRLVALCSDGVTAFSSIETGQIAPVNQILEGLLTFKTTAGEFVTRRAKRLLKELDKQNIFPADDLSVAAMLW